MIYLPILGAVVLATITILEKIVLKRKKINIRLMQTAGFFSAVVVMIPFLYFFGNIDYSNALLLKNIFIFIFIILFSLVANLLYFYSIKWEKINNIEPARILEPLFVILLAIIFSFIFGTSLYERNLNIIIPALIAAGALIFSHIQKHHIHFNKYFIAAIFGSLFFAFELVLSRLILDYYNPLSFYFVRSFSIFLISFIIFRPKFSKIKSSKIKFQIFIVGTLWVIYRIIVYYGYINLGVIFTTLMLMLGPILIYAFARIFLKEKLNWRNIAASLVIIGAVLYAILI